MTTVLQQHNNAKHHILYMALELANQDVEGGLSQYS